MLPLATVNTLVRQRSVQGPPGGGGGGERRLRRGERLELKNRAKTAEGQFSGRTPKTQVWGMSGLTKTLLSDTPCQIPEPDK